MIPFFVPLATAALTLAALIPGDGGATLPVPPTPQSDHASTFTPVPSVGAPAIPMPKVMASTVPPIPIPIIKGYKPPAVPMPYVTGLVLSSAAYRIDNSKGPLLRADWMRMATPAGYSDYFRCHEARAGRLRNGAYLRPITVHTVYGRTRTKREANGCTVGRTPSPAGMKTAIQATFRNAAGTVTRSATIVVDTSKRTVRA